MNANENQPTANNVPTGNPPGAGQPANIIFYPQNPWQGMAAPYPYAAQRGKGYAVSAAVSVLAGLAVFGVACYYLRAPAPLPPPPPPPPAEPQVIVKEVVREVPKYVDRPVLRTEPPPPPV